MIIDPHHHDDAETRKNDPLKIFSDDDHLKKFFVRRHVCNFILNYYIHTF